MHRLFCTSLMFAFVTLIVPAGFAQSPGPNDRLFARIYGAEAGAVIGNAMGEPVEGWAWQKIEKEYGVLDRLIPSNNFTEDKVIPQRFGQPWVYHGHRRQAGWTEDGGERYKLLVQAIIKKNGRITIEDLANEWVEKIDPAKFGYNMGPQDMIIYHLLKAGMPPWEVGRYAMWPGFIGTSKMIMPIGMVNAGRPDNAARDALDLTRIKGQQGKTLWRTDKFVDGVVQSTLVWDCGNEVAAAIAAATAEALRPNATVDSIVKVALDQLPAGARKDVEANIAFARESRDWKDIRPKYDAYWQGTPISNAVEILAGGLTAFVAADGKPREAIIYAVNFGRDTDCKCYVAGGLAGALRGIEAIPPEWIKTVDEAVLTDPYTVSKLNTRQEAEAIYKAAMNELGKTRAALAEMDGMIGK